jgi:hypothetical protein
LTIALEKLSTFCAINVNIIDNKKLDFLTKISSFAE